MSTSLLNYIFRGSKTPQENSEWAIKNSRLQKILQDFPWLWGISKYWCASVTAIPEVRQNDVDLKLILASDSSSTRYSVWVFVTVACDVFNYEIFNVPRVKDMNWASAIMNSVYRRKDIVYLVVVDPVYGEDHPHKSTTILRAEGKVPLNSMVEEVTRLTGNEHSWVSPSFIDEW
jgi:hypothetical protein